MDAPLKGRVILITGATNGIGLVTARELARSGAQVTIIGRNPEKCASVADSIGLATGTPLEYIVADLSTLAGIRQAAAQFRQNHTHLHVLINNAGGFFIKHTITPDGFEYTFALNHLGYFLLTDLLLDLLKASAPARIINISSGAHSGLKELDFDNLQGEKSYSGWKAYARSKLENLLFTYELAHRLDGSRVTVNAVHPGYVATGFALNNGWVFRVFANWSAHIFGHSPEQGASTGIYLATSPDVEGVTGKYFADSTPLRSSPASYDQAAQIKLWQVSQKLIASHSDGND